MKNLMKTVVLAVSFIFAGSVFAAGGQGHHGAKIELGEQMSESWTVVAEQFGNMTADSKELVYTILVKSNGGELKAVEAVRFWFGDVDSDSLVAKLEPRYIDSEEYGELLYIHGHMAVENGDDHTRFTIEMDTGADEGEILTFKTK